MTAAYAAWVLLAATAPAPVVVLPVATQTRAGTPGDPVNLLLVGTRDELVAAFCAAGWSPADPITARSAVRTGISVALDRPYTQAPVSDLYLFGRVQDLAFERSIDGSARSRHHVRFWQVACSPDGRAMWAGAGTFDVRVGRSPATGRMTHRIDPAIDAERETILCDLARAGWLAQTSRLERDGPFTGRNGEGDCYFTDGAVGVGVLATRVCSCSPLVAPNRPLRRR
ncbi:MAG TPA: LssY C-terminal domain-containing protein [Gemmataceae bacterium]|nr:LssY C-terminal domain-containing protein [Gemmataceae bacterium]